MSIDDADAALRIVEAGRQRVHTRLKDAFAHQIAGHAELTEIDPDVLEQLVSESAGRAGASLWRIALAEGAAEEFGVGIAEALAHPAVSAAEQLIGPPAEPEPVPDDAGLPAQALRPDPEPDGAVPDDAEPIPAAWVDEAAPQAPADAAADPWPAPLVSAADEPAPTPTETVTETTTAPPDPVTAPSAIRIAAVHTGGIESLKEGETDLELRLADAGLDVIKASTGVAIGRLEWREITSVEVTPPRRGLRKKAAELAVHTGRGQATFELPALTEAEMTEHVAPMLERLRAAGAMAPDPG